MEHEVVPAAEFGVYAERGKRAQHYAEIRVLIFVFFARYESKVEIAAIVPHRAAARKPPRKHTARALQSVHAALGVSVLIAPYHDRVRIAPQIQCGFVLSDVLRQRGFQRLIDEHVVAGAFEKDQSFDAHMISI